MADQSRDLVEEGKDLYSRCVNEALGGCQLIEERLKTHIEHHFNLVRAYLAERLYFDFKREDYQDASLERLTKVFSKICDNKVLVRELNVFGKRRNHIAHRALLVLYGPSLSPRKYHDLMLEVQVDMEKISALLEHLNAELAKLAPK